MKPSKVAAAVSGDPSFFKGLVEAQVMSGSGHHHPLPESSVASAANSPAQHADAAA